MQKLLFVKGATEYNHKRQYRMNPVNNTPVFRLDAHGATSRRQTCRASLSSYIALNVESLRSVKEILDKDLVKEMFPQTVSILKGSGGLDQGVSCGRGLSSAPARAKVPLWDVHAHFDCAGSHTVPCSLPKVYFCRRAVLVC